MSDNIIKEIALENSQASYQIGADAQNIDYNVGENDTRSLTEIIGNNINETSLSERISDNENLLTTLITSFNNLNTQVINNIEKVSEQDTKFKTLVQQYTNVLNKISSITSPSFVSQIIWDTANNRSLREVLGNLQNMPYNSVRTWLEAIGIGTHRFREGAVWHKIINEMPISYTEKFIPNAILTYTPSIVYLNCEIEKGSWYRSSILKGATVVDNPSDAQIKMYIYEIPAASSKSEVLGIYTNIDINGAWDYALNPTTTTISSSDRFIYLINDEQIISQNHMLNYKYPIYSATEQNYSIGFLPISTEDTMYFTIYSFEPNKDLSNDIQVFKSSFQNYLFKLNNHSNIKDNLINSIWGETEIIDFWKNNAQAIIEYLYKKLLNFKIGKILASNANVKTFNSNFNFKNKFNIRYKDSNNNVIKKYVRLGNDVGAFQMCLSPIEANTEYTFSCKIPQNYENSNPSTWNVSIIQEDGNGHGTIINNLTLSKVENILFCTFTTAATTQNIKIKAAIQLPSNDIITCTDFMLNMGTSIEPYELFAHPGNNAFIEIPNTAFIPAGLTISDI